MLRLALENERYVMTMNSVCSPPALPISVLLASADQALYRAKEAGRGCYRVCDPDAIVIAVRQ